MRCVIILPLLHLTIDKGLQTHGLCLLEERLSLLCLVSVNLDVDDLIARHRVEARVQVRYDSHDVIEMIKG